MRFATRLTPRLLEAIVQVDNGRDPIAEVWRQVSELAESHGRKRPSYERIRTLVHAIRALRRRRGPSTGRVLLEVVMRVRPPEALADHVAGIGVPRLPP